MKTAYIGGIVLDGTKDMAPQKGMTVVVENGRIKELLSSEELIPSDCEIVHLQGSYLMPGLITGKKRPRVTSAWSSSPLPTR